MDRENPRFDDMQKYALSAEKKREVLKKVCNDFSKYYGTSVNHFFDNKSISHCNYAKYDKKD